MIREYYTPTRFVWRAVILLAAALQMALELPTLNRPATEPEKQARRRADIALRYCRLKGFL